MNLATFDESSHVLPPMPGALIVQLSNILGHMSSFDVLLIKQFMIKGALELGLAPAAIAICWSMLCDAAFAKQNEDAPSDAKWTKRHEFLVQYCISVCVTGVQFRNVDIKKDLCSQSLRLFGANDLPFQHMILKAYSTLEYQENPREDNLGNPFFNMTVVGEVSQATSVDVSALISSLPNCFSANDSVLSDLSQAFLNWVVEHVFATRNSMLSTFKVRMVLELATSCLAELTNNQTASLVIDMALEEFATNSNAFKCTSSASNSTQPDPTLVQRLHDRGYSWNAARRACVMTNNRGYSNALEWAVAHFQDEDFDSPLFSLNNENGSCRYQNELISLVKDTLQSIKARYESGKPGEKPVISKPKMPPLPPTQPAPVKDVSGNSVSLSRPVHMPPINESDLHQKTPTPLDLQKDTSIMSPLHNNPFIETPTNASTKGNGGAMPNSADSMSSIDGSLGSRASMKRQISRGREVLGTQKFSADERKRLAAEGKRLLEAARMRNKGVVAPPTSIVTKSIPDND